MTSLATQGTPMPDPMAVQLRKTDITASLVFDIAAGMPPLVLADEPDGTTLTPATLTIVYHKTAGQPWTGSRVTIRGRAHGPMTGTGPSAVVYWLPKDDHRLPNWVRRTLDGGAHTVTEQSVAQVLNG
jgi:hypothetical protein